MAVQIRDISCVKPLKPTQRFHLPLVYVDSIFVGGDYMKNVLYFSHPAGSLDLQALKHALSVALVPFYPLAGRLHIEEDPNCRLTIDCNDAGVEFVEAVSTDLAFGGLAEQHFPIRDDLIRCPSPNDSPPDCPLLYIQVSRFEGGPDTGFAIGVAMSHVVGDGHSIFYFLKSWGECCRGVGVSLPPLHLRSVTEPECWGMEKHAKPRFSFADIGVPLDDFLKVVLSSPRAGSCRTMHFDRTVARELKQTAMAESGNVRISTFQAVIVCAWKRLCAALALPAHQEVMIRIPANLRHVILPSLTDAFFGNGAVHVSTSVTAGDLQRESLGLIAARIHESVQAFKDQAVLREKLGSLQKDIMAGFRRHLEGPEPVKQFTVSWGSKLPIFDVDVGMGSTLEALRPASFHDNTSIMVFGGKEEGSIDVYVRLPTQQSLDAFNSIPCPCIDF